MKASTRLVVIVEGLLFVALAFLINLVFPNNVSSLHIAFEIGFTLIIFYAFRRGAGPGVAAGALLGICACFTVEQPREHIGQMVGMVIASACLGIAGCFARNLQRTLFNKRMKSVYLNLVTGTLLSLLAYFFIRFLAMQFFMPDLGLTVGENIKENLASFIVNGVIILAILIVMLNTIQKHFIPRNTKYISRRERSRLLND